MRSHRPVSVNSLTRVPAPVEEPISSQREVVTTTTEIQVPEIAQLTISAPVDDSSIRSLPESTPPTSPEETSEVKTPRCLLVTLPNELHDMILENIFGDCPSGFPLETTGRDTLEGWQVALRHPRRKELSNLALVCRQWTYLVQSRIYKNSMPRELP